jgi:EAL domain-containing protein (putative c-di-GMP-specific phosphodiesterase class I)
VPFTRWSHSELSIAVEDGQICPFFQPVVSLVDGRVAGVEALLRWQHPAHGTLPAAAFVDEASQNGLVPQLFEETLDTACMLAATLSAELGREQFVSVNVDPPELGRAGLTEVVASALTRAGTRADNLVLEVTEKQGTLNASATSYALQQITALGVHVAIDDFGTGHSSLTRLKQLRARKIKIDQSFVRDIVDDPDDQAIVAGVVKMAEGLGLDCIAEGIENESQAAVLTELRCSAGQGFLWCDAVPASEVCAQVRRIDEAAAPIPPEHSRPTWHSDVSGTR